MILIKWAASELNEMQMLHPRLPADDDIEPGDKTQGIQIACLPENTNVIGNSIDHHCT